MCTVLTVLEVVLVVLEVVLTASSTTASTTASCPCKAPLPPWGHDFSFSTVYYTWDNYKSLPMLELWTARTRSREEPSKAIERPLKAFLKGVWKIFGGPLR